MIMALVSTMGQTKGTYFKIGERRVFKQLLASDNTLGRAISN